MVKQANLHKLSDASLRTIYGKAKDPDKRHAAAMELARRNQLSNKVRRVKSALRLEPQERRRLQQLGGFLGRVAGEAKKRSPKRGGYFDRLADRYSR